MIFKKGDRVRSDDGQVGEVLFVDRNGLEVQVAFQRLTQKVLSDSLSMMEPGEVMPPLVAPVKARRTPASGSRRTTKS